MSAGTSIIQLAKDYKISKRCIQYWKNPRDPKTSRKVGAPAKLSKRQSKWVKELLTKEKLSSGDV